MFCCIGVCVGVEGGGYFEEWWCGYWAGGGWEFYGVVFCVFFLFCVFVCDGIRYVFCSLVVGVGDLG